MPSCELTNEVRRTESVRSWEATNASFRPTKPSARRLRADTVGSWGQREHRPRGKRGLRRGLSCRPRGAIYRELRRPRTTFLETLRRQCSWRLPFPGVLPDGPGPGPLECFARVQNYGHRTLIHELHLHHFLEAAGLAAQARGLDALHKQFVQPSRLLRRSCFIK